MRRPAQSSRNLHSGSPEVLAGEPFDVHANVKAYRVRLYVAGNDRKSQQAIESLHKLAALFAPGRFNTEIIDLRKRTDLARQDGVLAVPALVKIFPPPTTSFIGATWDHRMILRRLGIPFDPAAMIDYPRRRRTQS